MLCSCSPEIEAPYVQEEEKERLLGLYQYLHSRAHNSSRPLKNIYFTGPRENLLAWVRPLVGFGEPVLSGPAWWGRGVVTLHSTSSLVPSMVLLGLSLPLCEGGTSRGSRGSW